jgi:PiT family inorganic phosphate transporter
MAFIILGAVINGPAAMETMSQLGGIGSLPVALAVTLASAAAIACMCAAGLPVSAAQTGVGALIGYQLFQQGAISAATRNLLQTIVVAWICAPVMAALLAFVIYNAAARIFRRVPMPLFSMDRWLRLGLVVVGCYGAWAFGGNNMANVVGFYAGIDLFAPIPVGPWNVSQPQILALSGAIAVSLGVATYSRRIMLTVGRDLVRLDAVSALIAVLAQALVVDFLAHSWRLGPYALPAIPISVSQALVGAVLGLGAARGIQTIRLRILGNILTGWIAAPLISAGLTVVLLYLPFRLAG